MTRVLAVLVLATAALAAGPEVRPRTEHLFMDPCAECRGKWLPNCRQASCKGATDFRAWLAEQERAGKSDDQIKAQAIALHGATIIAAPDKQGVTWTAYLLPLAILPVGALVIILLARAWMRRTREDAALHPPAELTEAERARVEEEVKNL